jgi:hypothetical protein
MKEKFMNRLGMLSWGAMMLALSGVGLWMMWAAWPDAKTTSDRFLLILFGSVCVVWVPATIYLVREGFRTQAWLEAKIDRR